MMNAIAKLSLILGLLLAATAHAALIECDVAFSDDPGLSKHAYQIDAATDSILLHEGAVTALGADPSLTCDGVISSAVVLHIDEDALNDSGVQWNGWKLELDPAGSAVFTDDGVAPASSHFLSYSITDGGYTMQFDAPAVVADGQTLTLDFYIAIPWDGSGSFNFELTQTIIPEAGTLTLLLVGGLVLLRRRGRAA